MVYDWKKQETGNNGQLRMVLEGLSATVPNVTAFVEMLHWTNLPINNVRQKCFIH